MQQDLPYGRRLPSYWEYFLTEADYARYRELTDLLVEDPTDELQAEMDALAVVGKGLQKAAGYPLPVRL